MASAGLKYFYGTLIFAGLEIVFFLSVFFSKHPPSTKTLIQTLAGTGVVCCWLLWSIFYIAQMNPLVNPELKGE